MFHKCIITLSEMTDPVHSTPLPSAPCDEPQNDKLTAHTAKQNGLLEVEQSQKLFQRSKEKPNIITCLQPTNPVKVTH